ncbi:hypothetical protein C0992_003248 [Termitomyces sp. T32_za158]|nr:hypothetical protein C0992_003248 [Termitomyces sp. T32_za158]
MARKSSKKADGPVQSVLKMRDTGLREMVSSNVSQSRMKSATGRMVGQRTPSYDPQNLARKSGWTVNVPQESTSNLASSPFSIPNGSYAPLRSVGSFHSDNNAIAGPSHSRDVFQGTELPTIYLTENLKHQGPLALPSPSMNCDQPNRNVVQNYGGMPPAGWRPSVMMPTESVVLSVKSGPMKPHWQRDDEERAREQEDIDRTDHVDRDLTKRIGPARRSTDTTQPQRFRGAPKHLKSYVGRNLTLRKEDELDSDSDSPMEIDGQSRPSRKIVRPQAGFKGARKREWPQPPLSDPDSSDDEASSDEVDELDPSDSSPSEEDQYDNEGVDDSDIEEIVITARRQRSLSPAEIEILPGPPRPPSPLSISEGMMTAIADLSLSSVWCLRLSVTDPLTELEEQDEHGVSPIRQSVSVTTPLHVTRTRRQQSNISSPFPFVTLSPSKSVSSSTQARAQNLASSLQANRKVQLRDSLTPLTPSSRDSRSLMTSATPPPSSSRERSATTGISTISSTAQRHPHDTRYPTPPPPNNPLGPAAQFPYLPAKSEYGGPDIYYSCRPGGPCLYDLLNTLPLEPYGVLAWDILDREDEIFDSDNVKDEYKVMHALWGRWIYLNRNKFIKDYYKGTKAFIDFYWRMIHRAAGWDALRYWLLMLVVNRFITGDEVASLLKYYESLTGMDTWYH